MAATRIHAAIVLRGIEPMRRPTLANVEPMDDSILLPIDSTQDVIF